MILTVPRNHDFSQLLKLKHAQKYLNGRRKSVGIDDKWNEPFFGIVFQKGKESV